MLKSAISLWLAVNAPAIVTKTNSRPIHTFVQSALHETPKYLTDPVIHSRLTTLYIDLANRQRSLSSEDCCKHTRRLSNETLAYNILRLAATLYSQDCELHRDLARLRNYETAERFLQDLAYGEIHFDRE